MTPRHLVNYYRRLGVTYDHNTLKRDVGTFFEKAVNNKSKGVVPEDLNLHLNCSEIHK
jgi:hypothetical protein